VEILVTDATVFKYNFPIVGNLKNKLIVGIESIDDGFQKVTPDNFLVVPHFTYIQSYLTLINKKTRSNFNRIPLYSIFLEPGLIKQLNYQEIDWENCFIEIANNPAAPLPAPAGTSFLFIVHYIDKPSSNALIGRINQYTEILNRTAA
jgi:hypothetical protein